MLLRLANRKKGKETVIDRFLPLLFLYFVLLFGVGGDLLSHNLPVAVPSACAGLASGFGMGPGVSLQLLTTDKHTKHSNPEVCFRVLCQILHSGRGHDSDKFVVSCFVAFCQHT